MTWNQPNKTFFSQFLAKKEVSYPVILRVSVIFGLVIISLFFDFSSLPFLAFAGMTDVKEGKEKQQEKKEEGKEKQQEKKEEQGENKSIKDLQRIISEKDKTIQELFKKTSSFEEVQKNFVQFLEKQELKDLEQKYPDISPLALLGKTTEQREAIIKDFRERSQRVYGDSAFFSEKHYTSLEAIDKDIEVVKEDKRMSPQAKVLEVMKLTRLKNKLN